MGTGPRLLFGHAAGLPLRLRGASGLRPVRIAHVRRFSLSASEATPDAGKRALVIVESPAKAATIQRFLPSASFAVRSCVGHVRELPSSAKRIPAKYKGLPWARLGVDVSDGFRPLYVLIEGKRRVIAELKAELAERDELILATDEDREGEAISWHLVELLKPDVPVRRAVFHEITPEAVKAGVASTRDIDLALVQAQETRRVLDRLAGYTMSPLLWRKIAKGLSAGRVQSVAMALIVRRELERLRFVNAEYVSSDSRFSAGDRELEASLLTVDGVRLAKRTDFDEEMGGLKDGVDPNSLLWCTVDELQVLLDKCDPSPAVVTSVDRKRKSRNAPIPLITSTLQQECGNKLGMGAGRTMRAAQKLYESGFITYHRTDNPMLSDQAVTATRDAVEKLYGAENLGSAESAVKKSAAKTPKGAQAAHEAIRPAGTEFVLPEDAKLEEMDQYRVYELIFRRTLASQMAPAAVDTTAIALEKTFDGGKALSFKATGSVIVFPGHLLATKGMEAESTSSQFLPDVHEGEEFDMDPPHITQHSTKPPARYNDASLVKELEELGVGRPSTYASIIEKLIERGYTYRGKGLGEHKGVSRQALVPSLAAFAVERLLSAHFPSFVDAEFTANMEATLDQIAAGTADRTEYLSSYYSGEDGLAASVERTEKGIDPVAFRRIVLPNLPPGMNDTDDTANVPAKKRGSKAPTKRRPRSTKAGKSADTDWSTTKLLVNSYGPYLERDGRVLAGLPRSTLAEDLSADRLEQVIRIAQDPPVLGLHPRTGEPIMLKTSSYGPYVQMGRNEDSAPGEKPRRAGLLPGMDPATLDVETAARLLELPRVVGLHPRDGGEVVAARGPYGSYITHAGANVSLRGEAERVLDVGLDECVRLVDEAAERRRVREEKQAAKAAANLEAAKEKTKAKTKPAVKAKAKSAAKVKAEGTAKQSPKAKASAKAKRSPKAKEVSAQ